MKNYLSLLFEYYHSFDLYLFADDRVVEFDYIPGVIVGVLRPNYIFDRTGIGVYGITAWYYPNSG